MLIFFYNNLYSKHFLLSYNIYVLILVKSHILFHINIMFYIKQK
nr:MAG TPA: hypothetical protein [Caudoviricetes sp.]